MSFPDIVRTEYVMDNAGICSVGQHLGYHLNAVCDAIREAEFYAQNGDGSFVVYREGTEDADGEPYSEQPMIQAIFTAIFAQYPQAQEIRVVN